MLSMLELEAYYQALQAIEDIKAKIEATTLRAMNYEKISSGNNYKGDTVGRIVTRIEDKSDALARLQIYVKKKRPDVEQTIAAAVAGMRGSAAIKIEMALKMHYLSGREWQEIADLLKTDAGQLKDKALQRLERI